MAAKVRGREELVTGSQNWHTNQVLWPVIGIPVVASLCGRIFRPVFDENPWDTVSRMEEVMLCVKPGGWALFSAGTAPPASLVTACPS